MVAANIMTTDVVRLTRAHTVLDALRAFCVEEGPRHIPVVDEGDKFQGFITPQKLLTAILPGNSSAAPDITGGRDLPALIRNIDAMAKTGLRGLVEEGFVSVPPEASIMEVAAHFVESRGCSCIPVLDNSKRLLGVITPGAVFRRLCEYQEKK